MATKSEGVSIERREFDDMPGIVAYVVSGDRFDTFLECVGKLVSDASLTVKSWSCDDGDGLVEVLVHGEPGDDCYDEVMSICKGY